MDNYYVPNFLKLTTTALYIITVSMNAYRSINPRSILDPGTMFLSKYQVTEEQKKVLTSKITFESKQS